MSISKDNGSLWGRASVIVAICGMMAPFLSIMAGSIAGESWGAETPFLIMFILFPPLSFVLAFIGKVRCASGTKARKQCNIGAGIGLALSAVLLCAALNTFWQEVFSVSMRASGIVGVVDALLIVGYFGIAYIRGQWLWFLH